MSQVKNMTEGSVVKRLITFALPLLLSNIVQSLYNVADMCIVGQFNGPIGIAGVNIGGQVTFLMTMIVIGISVGGTVVIAQYVGAKQIEKIQDTISTMLLSLAVAAVVITGIMLFLSTPILHLINTPPESFAEARAYLNITVVGLIFIFIYNALSAIMRGMGDSKTPMVFVTIACLTNVVLDYIMVGPMDMGAAGAALATIISQALSMTLCVIHLKRRSFMFDFKLSSFKFVPEQFKMLMKIGLPLSIQNVINNISFLFLTSLVNTFGVMAASAVGIVNKFNSFAFMPALAISSSVSTLSAQNLGAGRPDRATKTMLCGMVIAFSFTACMFALSQLFPEQILSLFDKTPAMLEAGKIYMRYFSFEYLIIPFMFCMNGLINGSGRSIVTAINNICASLLFRIPLAYIMGVVLPLGLTGLALSVPLSSLGATVIALIYVLSGKWKINRVVSTPVVSDLD